MLNHKEMTAHIRGRIKASGIKARVSLYTACGIRYIRVVTPSYEVKGFTSEELATLAIIAQVNRLTEAQSSPIDPAIMVQLTGKQQFDFEFHPSLM